MCARTSDEKPTRKFDWHGMLQRDHYNESTLASRDAIANAAKEYEWDTLLRLLDGDRSYVNTWRLGGETWYTPLHQAAHGGAPKAVVERLLTLGAWRTLRTAKGERAVDIAVKRRADHLAALLEPHPVHKVDATVLDRMQGHFHDVIRTRIARIDDVLKTVRLPELGPATEYSATFWFPVPGMYGGVAFWLAGNSARPTLVTESWCRVAEGSGQRHEITSAGATLVEEGFV